MTEDDIRLAERLADAAGVAIRPWFRQRFTREDKADASPVTEADRAAEAAMRAILEVERPADGIIGEEYGISREGAERTWVLDPIDGTRSFVVGRPIFGTLIALVEAGKPVLGIIDQPILRERWLGIEGRPTLLNRDAVTTRQCATLGEAQLATSGPRYFQPDQLAAYTRVTDAARDSIWGGDCYNYGLLAIGQIDAVIEAGLKIYDFSALVPIVEGAGGAMRDWTGNALNSDSDGRVIAVGDTRLIDPVLAILGG